MTKLKAVSLGLALLAATGVALGAFGFSSTAADRRVDVAVASDDDALVGYESSDLTVRNGRETGLVAVENRLTGEVAVTDVDVDAATLDAAGVTEPVVGPGERVDVRGTVYCEPGTTDSVAVSVTLSGPGVTARVSGDTRNRTFEVACTRTVEAARFDGAGNVDVDAPVVDETSVVYWTATDEDGEFDRHELAAFDPSRKLQAQGAGTHVVAVYFPHYDVTFLHPNYDRDTATVTRWGSGSGQWVYGRVVPGEN